MKNKSDKKLEEKELNESIDEMFAQLRNDILLNESDSPEFRSAHAFVESMSFRFALKDHFHTDFGSEIDIKNVEVLENEEDSVIVQIEYTNIHSDTPEEVFTVYGTYAEGDDKRFKFYHQKSETVSFFALS